MTVIFFIFDRSSEETPVCTCDTCVKLMFLLDQIEKK